MIKNLENGKVLVRQLHHADNFWRRFLGLLPYKQLTDAEGMLLTPCRSVHTFFMRFSIDVLYLDNQFKVVAAYAAVKPWRALPLVREARHILEVGAGAMESTGTKVGHRLGIT